MSSRRITHKASIRLLFELTHAAASLRACACTAMGHSGGASGRGYTLSLTADEVAAMFERGYGGPPIALSPEDDVYPDQFANPLVSHPARGEDGGHSERQATDDADVDPRYATPLYPGVGCLEPMSSPPVVIRHRRPRRYGQDESGSPVRPRRISGSHCLRARRQ
jgi:hypothetical protein